MVKDLDAERERVARMKSQWLAALARFDAASPAESAIAALELEAAARRYMLALANMRPFTEISTEEEAPCPR